MQKKCVMLIFILTLLLTACQDEATDETTPEGDTIGDAAMATQDIVSPTVTVNEVASSISPISPINVLPSPTVAVAENEATPTPPILTPVKEVAEEVVVIEAANNSQLHGTLFGRGKNLVIIMKGPNESEADWANQAKTIAAQGFMVLIYTAEESASSTETVDFEQQLDYIKAIIEFAKDKGATEHILFGVAENGTVAIKAASQTNAKAVVTFSTPISNGSLTLTASDLKAISSPKLFIDTTLSATKLDAEQMFGWADTPKTWRFLPGSAAGAEMYKEEYSQNLTDFIAAFFLFRFS